VLIVRIENPPRNFMDRQMVAELTALMRTLASDRSVGSVVLTGKPDDLFVTHYDVAEMLAGAEQSSMEVSAGVAGVSYRTVTGVARLPRARAGLRRTPLGGVLDLQSLHTLFRRIERLDKVVIAAINGQALSIGCELSLACDIRYMADDARAIGLPEMTLGVLPGAGGTQRLARTVGPARALELILEARLLTPEEALDAGLVHRVLPHAQLLPKAVETAHRLARRTPVSVAAAKRAVWEGASSPLTEGLALERKWFMAALSRPAARRAMRQYVDEVDRTGRAPWEEASARDAWQEGTVVDLLAPDD
jgi:enoyl-CoA hydratase/carnithine racemase